MSESPPAYAYLCAADLDPITLPEVLECRQTGVFVEPPGTVRTGRRRAAEFHDDPDGARLFTVREAVAQSGPPFVASLRNVRLVGYRMFMTADGHLTNDDVAREPAALKQWLQAFPTARFSNEETGLLAAGGHNRFTLDLGGRTVRRVEGKTVFLGSHEPANYGSFIFRLLPKMVNFLRSNEKFKFMLYYYGRPTYAEYLDLLGVEEDRLVRHNPAVVYDFDEVILPSLRNPSGFLDEESRQLFSGMRMIFGPPPSAPRTKIYVSRWKPDQLTRPGRVMRNEGLLIERLTREGFLIVDPAMMSAKEQINTFAQADLVVGPSGAGMFNTVFCRPGTRVIDIESEPYWIWGHSFLFSSSELRYAIFEGLFDHNGPPPKYPKHRPWNVNIDALMTRIDEFI